MMTYDGDAIFSSTGILDQDNVRRPSAFSTRSWEPPSFHSTPPPRRPTMATPASKSEPAHGLSSVATSSASQELPPPAIINDPSLLPAPFHGTIQERAQEWLNYFQCYATFKQLTERASLALFALLVRDTAN